MKLTKNMKSILIKKISEALTEEITLDEYNEAFLYLDRVDDALNLVPYNIFEQGYQELLVNTEAGRLFEAWLTVRTLNIEKDFNKGRKVVRLIRDLVCDHRDSLAFNLSSNKIMTIMMTSLFVKYNPEETPFVHEVEDEKRFVEVLNKLREYIAIIFYIDYVDTDTEVENLLDIFINEDKDKIIESITHLGVLHIQNEVL